MSTQKKGGTPSTETKSKRTAPDWERIELDYRAGIKTLRQIAGDHGISHAAINKRAKKEGWERDLKGKIQAKADALVTKATVTKKVSTETTVSERDTIEANAHAIAEVRLSHRRDIQRSRRITMALLEELEQQAGGEQVELLQRLGEIMRNESDNGSDKLNDLYHKIISLPQRAKTMRDLGESLRVLVGLERQAFGMDDKDQAPADGLTTLLNSIASNSSSSIAPVADDPELPPEPAGSALPIGRGDDHG